jgi:hypothetical protein
MTGWVRGGDVGTRSTRYAGAVWRQEEAPCRKVSTFGQESDEGNKDIIGTECDMRLSGTNKEAGGTGRTKDARRQSRMNLDGPGADK